MKKTTRSSETSVFAYKTTRCQDPEDHNPKNPHRENLKNSFLFIAEAEISLLPTAGAQTQ